ncbi:hypothetical protein FOXB_11540 [Fusarium oxysporum f. sp. conglutinans Fo5176]|uniref:Uncharacterized protein n=2 Tax=Fusarium oxysporum f. sp. conglutinans TaxID=100902 RepID=F9FYQ8_FUSOF|nr:hypothetical protein FOXB_11540 [Fusarium oxysporum f. sp. conglutinans Fo5176]
MDPGDTKPPEKSSNQYTGDVCHILSRSQGHPLIPRTILKKCSKLAALLDKKQIFSKPLYTVDIEDCPFSVGHIIIHYLITDKYQCLKPEGQTEDDRSCSELATAFRAHAAAVDLELPSLQLLASSEMRRLEGESEFSLDNADIEQHRTTTRSVSDNYGKLCISLQHARLQELQNFSVKLSEDLHTCKTDLAASKTRSQQLTMEGKAIVESHEIQSIHERQRRQNGFLSLGDRLRLRSAQSRSNDLSAAVSVHPLVDPSAKGPKLISPDQEEEDQPEDGEWSPISGLPDV